METACIHGTLSIKCRRPYLLLEVIIAFALVVLCILPLLQPHWTINRVERQLQRDFLAERTVRNIYIHLLELMYRNEISWEQLMVPEPSPVEPIFSAELEQIGYRGFWKIEDKARKGGVVSVHNLNLTITLQPIDGGDAQKYNYRVFAMRDLSEESEEEVQ